MNKGIYRIVFSKCRGSLMVVGELAKSKVKASGSDSGVVDSRKGLALLASLKPLSLALLFATGNLLVCGSAQATILSDKDAPQSQQATVLTSANGVPQVNIQTPTAGGVSRNQYSQFDVDSRGVIVNNSRTHTLTELGGFVTANPYLLTGSASVIVNEVNSTDPSLLNGYVEIAGQQADIIFANPAGITCSGCGFINANQATLTTGRPVYNGAGNLDSFRVQGGRINIEGQGLDASQVNFTNIIAQSTRVNAGIWANELAVTTGNNSVSVDNTRVSQINSGGGSPQFAIDVSELGGMYAQQIRLIGTADGVGVRNAGRIGASAGEVSLTVDGELVNTGQIDSTRNIVIEANGNVSNSGDLYAGEILDIDTTGELEQSGSIEAENVQINAAGNINNSGNIYAGDSVDIETAGEIEHSGVIAAFNTVKVNAAGDIRTTQNSVLAAGVNSDGSFRSSGSVQANLTVTSDRDIFMQGQQLALNGISLTAQSVTLQESSQEAQSLEINATDGDVNIDSTQIVVSTFSFRGQSVSLTNSEQTADQGRIVATDGNIDLTSSTLEIEQQLSLDANQTLIVDNADITAGAFDFTANSVSNSGGKLNQTGQGDIDLQFAGTFDNTGGQLQTSGKLKIDALQLINQHGRLAALEHLHIRTTDLIDNQHGTILSSQETTINSGAINNDQGLIQGEDGITIDANGQLISNTNSGTDKGIISGKTIQIQAGSLNNDSGYMGAGDNLDVTLSGAVSNQSGVMESLRAVSLTSTNFNNDAGRIQSGEALTINTGSGIFTNTNSGANAGLISGGQLTLNTASLNNDTGYIGSAKAMGITTSGDSSNRQGTIESEETMNLNTRALDNDQGLIQSGDNLTVNTNGQTLTNTNSGANGGLASKGKLTLNAGSLNNTAGYVGSENDMLITARGSNQNVNGLIESQNKLTFNSGEFNNHQGMIRAHSDLRIDTETGTSIINTGNLGTGGIRSNAQLILNTHELNNSGGDIASLLGLTINAASDIRNVGGNIISSDSLQITSNKLNNDQGKLQSGADMSINTRGHALINTNSGADKGIISSGKLAINSGAINNTAGYIGATDNIDINSTATLNNTGNGVILGLADVSVTATGADNRTGQIQAAEDIILNLGSAGELNNENGLLRANKSLTVTAGRINNRNTKSADKGIEGETVLLQVDNVDNNNGQILADDLTIHGKGQIGNQSGIMSAGEHLTIRDTSATKIQTIDNASGTLIAGQQLDINSKGLSGDGKVLSRGSMNINLTDSYTHTGELKANGNLTFNTAGTLTNRSLFVANGVLDVVAAVIDNTVNGEFSSTNTKLRASGNLVNRGLIDGTTTSIAANNLYNYGSGRIYGDHISIAANALYNHAEGGRSAVIAARNELDIGVATLSNRDHSLIYSGGHASIQGAISGGQATGRAGTITNASATIEAAGALNINANRLNNLNNDLRTTTQSRAETSTEYAINSFHNTRYTSGQVSFYHNEVSHIRTPAGNSDNYYRFNVTRNITEDVISHTDPGKIRSGQGMSLNVSTINNADSSITAGGSLTASGASFLNSDTKGNRTIAESGSYQQYWRIKKKGRDRQGFASSNYTGATQTTQIDLNSSVYRGNTSTNQGFTIRNNTLNGVTESAVGAQTKQLIKRAVLVKGVDNIKVKPIANQAKSALSQRQLAQFTQISNGSGFVRSQNGAFSASDNSLFLQNPSPTANYLVETDPRFTRESLWLSSSYFTSLIGLSPNVITKRLGDGFYEQKLIREQIIALTGKRYFDNYTDDETQFKALMDNAVAYAKEFDLRPGITLTEEQMSRLTNDIVWMETQDVVLADGSTQQVLVPKVYAVVRDGDILPSGSIVSGDNVQLNMKDDIVNSGALIARSSLDLSGNNIQDNGGRLQAASTRVNAENDVTLEGSVWRSDGDLSISAKRDVNIRTQQESHRFASGKSQTIATNQASIEVTEGDLNIVSGRNTRLTAANLKNEGKGDINLFAKKDLTLDTVVEKTNYRDSRFKLSTRNEVTSTVSGQGNVNLQAGEDLSLRGATVDADKSLNLQGDNIELTTAENRNDSDYNAGRRIRIAKDLRNDGVDLSAGENVTLIAQNDLTSKGSSINAENNIALNAGGDTEISVAQDETYRFAKDTKKKSFGRKKTTIRESFSTDNVGGDITAGNNLSINANINQDGSVTANESGSVLIRGSDLTAENEVAISGDGVTIQDQKEVTFSRVETHKRGFAGLSSKSTGRINREELIDSSEVRTNERDLSLLSAENINIVGSELMSGGDINLQAVDDVIVTADVALAQVQEWSKKTSFLSSLDSLYEMEEKMSGSTTNNVVASTVTAGGNVNIDAGRAKVVGSDIKAGNDINVETDIGDIEIVSAQSTTDSYSNETRVKVGLSDVFEQITDVEALTESLSDGQLKISIAKATYDKMDTKTNATNHRGSQLIANNNVNLDAAGDIAVTGSDIIADADANQQGDASLVAGGDVTIKETADISDTETEEVHGKGELSFVVQHQAVEVVKAAEAVKDAKDKLKQAKEDYRKYKKDLTLLKEQRNKLQADYDNKMPGLMYEDIIELDDLIGELESDKEWYQTGIALAATNLTSKSTLLVQQTAAAAQSTATYGFNAGIQIDLEASKTKTTSHSEVSRGSNIVGNNINIRTGNGPEANIDDTATRITGSHLQADSNINITTGDLTIEASKDDNSSNTNTEQASIRIAQTVYGAAGGPTISADYSRSRAKDNNTTYNNSSLNAENISLSSTGDTTIKGANIKAEDELSLDVGENLVVQSVQNRYSADSKSAGISGGFSLGAADGAAKNGQTLSGAAKNIGSSNGKVSGVSAGLHAGSGRTRTKETVLTELIGGTVNINVGENTKLVGATIAAQDADGKDNGQLTLKTDSFDFGDLSNTHYDNQRNTGINTGFSISGGSKDPNTGKASESNVSVNTSSLTHSNASSYSKNKTLATLGLGNVIVASDQNTGEDSLERLNRDTDNTTKDLYEVDRQQGNVDVTLDTRLLTESGRQQIKNDAVDTKEFGEDIARAASNVSKDENLSGFGDFWRNLDNNAKGTQLKNDLLRNPENAHILEGLKDGEGSDAYAQAMKDLGNLAQDKFGLSATDIFLYDAKTTTSTSLKDNVLLDRKAGTVIDENHAEYGNIAIDANDNKTGHVNSLGQEIIESRTLQEGGSNDNRQEALSVAFGVQLSDRIDQAAGGNLDSTASANFTQNLLNTSSVKTGTQRANSVGGSAVAHRQLYTREAQRLDSAKRSIALRSDLTEQQKQVMQEQINALACAEVKCAKGVPAVDKNYAVLSKMQEEGEKLKEQGISLESMLGEPIAEGEFEYTWSNGVQDWRTRNDEVVQRTIGGVEMVAGAAGTVGGAAATVVSSPACISVAGCIAPAAAAGGTVLAANQAYDGATTLFGTYTSTEGESVLNSFSVESHEGDNGLIKDIAYGVGSYAVEKTVGKVIPDSIEKKVEDGLQKIVSGDGNKAGGSNNNIAANNKITEQEKVLGGAHKDTSKPVNDGLDSHHCPAKNCYKDAPISSEDGPAIKMDPKDHRRTASHGSSDEAKAYRARQQELLNEGKLNEAIEMDVDDIRSKFGDKYNEGIDEMLDYAEGLDPEDFKSK